MTALLEVKNISHSYRIGRQNNQVLRNVNFSINEGESVALVGDSGCGKSTLAKIILGLLTPSVGSVLFQSQDIRQIIKRDPLFLRRSMQVIFQDPYSSLNPAHNVATIIGEGITIHRLAKGEEKCQRIKELLVAVDLSPDFMSRYPHELSGGQRQRITIARALAVEPRLLICDEPMSALDEGTREKLIQLFKKLQQHFGLTYLLISHNQSLVSQLTTKTVDLCLRSDPCHTPLKL